MLNYKFIYIITVLCVIIIILMIILNVTKKKYLLKHNYGNKYKLIFKDSILPIKSIHNYSVSLWLYINDWNYLREKDKHILSHGSLDLKSNQCYPSIYITKKINNMKIYVTTSYGLEVFYVYDIPIKKWFHLYVNINRKSINIYKDNKLINVYLLKGYSILFNRDMHINHNGGFDGELYNLNLDLNDFDIKNIKKDFSNKPGSLYFNIMRKITDYKNKKPSLNICN